ncbi:MAG: CDP-diacylglycerol--glycerol-3-phosphate 3-phosphatidyltransferase [Firmicutes bacterium]|nr:CDP-diacylglycerol--glycerol-3-phosphate 3-phosphatidyltransferase [Bacillota bacterium]
MKMSLPNKLTIFRIILTFVIIIILLFPFYNLNIYFPEYNVNDTMKINGKYIISGILFIIASLTDFLDGYIARKYNLITDEGKLMDAIADKILVNSVIIILSSHGFINPIIPVVVIVRDVIVDSIKMLAATKGKVVAAIKSGKWKTACLMVGTVLTLFYNLPFELWNIHVSDVLLIIATVLSIISAIQYFTLNKNIIFSDN